MATIVLIRINVVTLKIPGSKISRFAFLLY